MVEGESLLFLKIESSGWINESSFINPIGKTILTLAMSDVKKFFLPFLVLSVFVIIKLQTFFFFLYRIIFPSQQHRNNATLELYVIRVEATMAAYVVQI